MEIKSTEKCWCFDLGTGALIINWIYLFLTTIYAAAIIYEIKIDKPYFWYHENQIYLLIIILMIPVLFAIMALYAIFQVKYGFMRQYLF